MEDKIRASVIIVNYNSWDDIKICLESLHDTVKSNDEVIVVENCSPSDDFSKIEKGFPWVRLIRSEENLGYGGGNNLGAREAMGEYLAFLNPDTTVEAGWLDALVSALESDDKVGLATSKILLMSDKNQINTCGNDMHISGLTLCRGMGKSKDIYKKSEHVSAISGAAFIVRKDLYSALGGFDESFFMYMEDADLSLRTSLAGWKCVTVPDSIVYHDYVLTFGPKKVFYQERNRYLLLLKNYRALTLIFLLPTLLFAEIVTWGFVILQDRKRWKNKIEAYGWIIKNWRSIQTLRKTVQGLRRKRDRVLILIETHRLDLLQVGKNPIVSIASFLFNIIFFICKILLVIFLWW